MYKFENFDFKLLFMAVIAVEDPISGRYIAHNEKLDKKLREELVISKKVRNLGKYFPSYSVTAGRETNQFDSLAEMLNQFFLLIQLVHFIFADKGLLKCGHHGLLHLHLLLKIIELGIIRNGSY